MSTHNTKVRQVMIDLGVDELTAWRHVRDREILRRRFQYQNDRKEETWA